MSSQKRIDANRCNAQNSTGPRTAAGKARSSQNALKHGLRAEQVVLPTEDPQAFNEHLEAWVEDWQPPSMARRHLVDQAAVASWRIKRCIRLESARISVRVEEAYKVWDQSVARQVEQSIERLEEDPAGVLEKMMSTRPGVDRLIRAWNEIGEAASEPDGWFDPAVHDRLFHLHGVRPGDRVASELRTLSTRLLLRHMDGDIEDGMVEPFDDDEAEEACDTIRSIAASKADELEELRKTLPPIEIKRNRHAELEAFAPRPEDAVFMRYEGQQNRVFKTSVDQLMKLAQTNADVAEEVAPNEATAIQPPAAVAPNEATAVEVKTAGRWASEPISPNEAKPGWSDVPVDRVKRGPDGGIWSTVPVPLAPIS
jgi:hypothetical protein